MTLTPRSIRLDLKCGKGAISKGEKCNKGAATAVAAAGLVAGAVALGALASRRRGRPSSTSRGVTSPKSKGTQPPSQAEPPTAPRRSTPAGPAAARRPSTPVNTTAPKPVTQRSQTQPRKATAPLVSHKTASKQFEDIHIPESASRPITAKTYKSRIEGAAELFLKWTATPGAPDNMTLTDAKLLVERKGRLLDTSKIPGLDSDKALNEHSVGRSSEDTRKMRAAYLKFYTQDSIDTFSRLDLKCGRGSISRGEKCSKGTAVDSRTVAAVGLTAGALTLGALALRSRRSVGSTPRTPAPGAPGAVPPGPRPQGPPSLPGTAAPFGYLRAAPPWQSKTQRMRANTAAAVRTAEARLAQTTREEVRRIAQIGNTMAAAGEATGMAAKTTLRELRLRTEAARRRFEPGYRSAPAAKPKTPAQLSPGMEPAFEVPLNPPRRRSPEAASVDPRTGQPRRRRARGFGRRDSGVVFYGSQVINPARRDTDDGKKYTKVVTNPETGRKNTVRYGAKGYKIAPGTNKGDNYCARSFGDMKSEGYDCSGAERNTPLCLSRAKWKCSGKTSRRGI